MMLSRRRFIGTTAGAVVGAPIVRSFGKDEVQDKLRIAVIGPAGQGAYNLGQVAHENVVALCEVDEPRADKARSQHPKAAFFTDYRKLLDKMAKEIDAVVIATPDHVHHHPAMLAMNAGKHVYVEKPLARTIAEARQMRETAAAKKLVTQMGTQIHAGDNYRRVVELVKSGTLGSVKHVHVWCNRAPDAGNRIEPLVGVKFDINQWLGPVPAEFFYANHAGWPHFHWRWWWAFGGGVLADMGCHFMDLAFWALDLGAPIKVRAEGIPLKGGNAPMPARMKVDYEFPGLKLTWYHGVDGPSLDGKRKYEGFTNGVLFEGDKGDLIADYGKRKLMPDDFAESTKAPDPTIAKSIGHHKEWLAAIRGNGKALCRFSYAGNLTEAVLLGNVAYRTGKELVWDAAAMKVTNTDEAAKYITPEVRSGWGV